MSLRVGFDIDGVLADFRTGFFEVAAQVLGRARANLREELDAVSEADARKIWKAITQTPNWWLGLAAYEPLQIARLYRLCREHKWEVFFMTTRVPTAGDSVQFQTQWWLEAQGFFLPSVVTVYGSRGDVVNSLRVDLLVDDQILNCAEAIGASKAKAILMLRRNNPELHKQATAAGIGVVERLADALEVLERLGEIGVERRRSFTKLSDWFSGKKNLEEATLPINPRELRPLTAADAPRE